MNQIKNQFGPVSNTGDFNGRYIVEVKEALLASILSDIHCLLFSKQPGTGKTESMVAAARKVFGDEVKFFRCDPTTEPEKMRGGFDEKVFYERHEFVDKIDNSLFDPKWKLVILDEWSRLNDPGIDIMMNLLDRNGTLSRALCWLTSNWLPKDERHKAPVDRIGIIKSVYPDISSISGLANSMLSTMDADYMDIGDGFPDKDTVADVRAARADKNTAEVVGKFLENFAENARKGLTDSNGMTTRSFDPNLRRIKQWFKLVYRTSVYAWGNEQFSEVHSYSKRMLQYAWVTSNEDELEDWKTFCNVGGVDPIDALVSSIMTNAAMRLKKIQKSVNPSDTVTLAKELGLFTSKSSAELEEALIEAGVTNPATDTHYIAATERLNRAFVAAVRNEDPFAAMEVNEAEIEEVEDETDSD